MIQVDVDIKNNDPMGSLNNAKNVILKKMRYLTRIDAKGQRMSEYAAVEGESQETKLVFDFKKMHDVMIG